MYYLSCGNTASIVCNVTGYKRYLSKEKSACQKKNAKKKKSEMLLKTLWGDFLYVANCIFVSNCINFEETWNYWYNLWILRICFILFLIILCLCFSLAKKLSLDFEGLLPLTWFISLVCTETWGFPYSKSDICISFVFTSGILIYIWYKFWYLIWNYDFIIYEELCTFFYQSHLFLFYFFSLAKEFSSEAEGLLTFMSYRSVCIVSLKLFFYCYFRVPFFFLRDKTL